MHFDPDITAGLKKLIQAGKRMEEEKHEKSDIPGYWLIVRSKWIAFPGDQYW
jgi:hypothetical protein